MSGGDERAKIRKSRLSGFDIMVSRTGDLGYEVCTGPENALMLWDAIFEVKESGHL